MYDRSAYISMILHVEVLWHFVAKEPEVIYSEPSMARDELVADDIAMKGNQAYATPPKTLQDSPSPVYEFIN